MSEYMNCTFKLCLCCDLGLFVRINKQKDFLSFIMGIALNGAYVMKSILFLKYPLLFIFCDFFFKKRSILVKVVT